MCWLNESRLWRVVAVLRSICFRAVRQPVLVELVVVAALVLHLRAGMNPTKTLAEEAAVFFDLTGIAVLLAASLRKKLFAIDKGNVTRITFGFVMILVGVLLEHTEMHELFSVVMILAESPLVRAALGVSAGVLWALIRVFYPPGKVVLCTLQALIGVVLLRDSPVTISQLETALDAEPLIGVSQLASLNLLAGVALIAKSLEDIFKDLGDLFREALTESKQWIGQRRKTKVSDAPPAG